VREHGREGKLLLWGEFEGIFQEQVANFNTECPIGQRDKPPLGYYVGAHVRVPDPQTLSFLLQDGGRRRITPHGVKIGGRWYWSDSVAIYVGTWCTVRYDPAAPESAWAYLEDDSVVLLRPKPLARWDGFGEANAIARRGARIQREFLKARYAEVAGSLTPEQRDPTGSYRTVAARLQRERVETPEPIRRAVQVQQRALAAAKSNDKEEKAEVDVARYVLDRLFGPRPEPAGEFARYADDLIRAYCRCWWAKETAPGGDEREKALERHGAALNTLREWLCSSDGRYWRSGACEQDVQFLSALGLPVKGAGRRASG